MSIMMVMHLPLPTLMGLDHPAAHSHHNQALRSMQVVMNFWHQRLPIFIGSNASFKVAPVEVNTVQKPIVGLLSYQENLESSDKHCIGQSPNCDPGMFTSSSSFLKRLVIFYACEEFCRFYGLSLSYYLLRH
jgi:hypothetical protein